MAPRTLREAAFVGRDQMRSYSPTMAERVPQTLQDLLTRFGMGKHQARKTGKALSDILALTPVGTLTAAADQYRGIDADLRAGRTPSSFGGGEVALAMLPGGARAAAPLQMAAKRGTIESMVNNSLSPTKMAALLEREIKRRNMHKFVDEFGDEYETLSKEVSKSRGSQSVYVHLERPNGELATVRLSDHSNTSMGQVKREGSRQDTPAIDLRPGDDWQDAVERLQAFFDGKLNMDMGRLPPLRPKE
jgi:hypothetical protein